MTKQDFLSVLKSVLSEELSTAQVNEQITFYQWYIDEQIAGGRTEEEVLEELGDARMIARNVIDGVEEEKGYYDQSTVTYTDDTDEANPEPAWKAKAKVYGILALVIAIVFLVLALITKLIIWLLPSILVIGCVVWALKRLNGR